MAGFNFGSTTPVPSAPATTGGFSFGAKPASAGSVATAAKPASGVLGFGTGSAATPPPSAPSASASAGGFSFGATASTTAVKPATIGAPVMTTAPSTSSTSGFSFGGKPANTASNTSTTPAPASAFSFSGSAASTPSAVPVTNNATAAAGGLSCSNTALRSSEASIKIPQFERTFPNLSMHSRIESILSTITNPTISSTDLRLQGEELVHLLSNQVFGQEMSNPNPNVGNSSNNTNSNCNAALRQKLTTEPNPTVLLPTQTRPTPIPRSILATILELSSLLNVSEEGAGSLYGASIVDHLQQGGETLGEETVAWFEKRKVLPGAAGKDFVRDVVADHMKKETYVGLKKNANVNSKMDESSDEDGKEAIHCAMDLYFLERGQKLETLRMLIQYRLSASSECAGKGVNNSFHENGGALDLNCVILEATDQLLQQGLISNLVQLVKDLTMKNEELTKKICLELDQEELQAQVGQGNQNLLGGLGGSSAPVTVPATGGFGGFQSNTSSTAVLGFGNSTTSPVTAVPVNSKKVTDADYAIYEFTFQQRQLACQCLFYLAYHTQCTMEETVAIIDLIRDLTNGQTNNDGSSSGCFGSGLPVLDPIRDVPDPYTLRWNQDGGVNMGMGMTPQQVKREKKSYEWKQELCSSLWSVRGLSKATVTTSHADFNGQQIYHAMTLERSTSTGGKEAVGGGKPQLMQSVSILILAAMCALDGNSVLMDRQLHGPNVGGAGNTLVPTDTLSIIDQTVKPISDRIASNSDGFSKWKRQDIAGLLSASFALLLRPLTNIEPSSVGESSNRPSTLMAMFRSSLEDPTIAKSMTFARVSLVPCLGSPSMNSPSPTVENDFAFFMSVLSEFTAKYLDAISSFGELPISRDKWMDNETQELQLRLVQEQQRKQLEQWSGKVYNAVELPTEVDVSQRPDCLDDIIALAILLCSSCQECCRRFWSNSSSEDVGEHSISYHLNPSKMMKKLEKQQAKDESLMPLYVSFLSVLALTDNPNEQPLVGANGADIICDWLSQNHRFDSTPTSYDASKQVKWDFVMYSIQYYTQQLSTQTQQSQSVWGSTDKFQESPKFDDDNTSYYYGTDSTSHLQSKSQQGSSNSVTNSTQKKELDQQGTTILTSLLSLVSHVALKSEKGREKILEMKMAPANNSSIREDDAISILFSLLVTSISPEIRGLTLTAIANLIRQSDRYNFHSKEEKDKSDDKMMKCWKLLDLCQIVPIAKLGQYSALQNEQNTLFPRSYGKKEVLNWFPPSEDYGIIYEMEYVEAKNGSYPSTEGLLKLLTALFSSDVLPPELGVEWRIQAGCTPYIEYVIDFVLPRTMQPNNSTAPLPFATPADKSRLVARALEVVDAVLTRYSPSNVPYSFQNEPSLVSESLNRGVKKDLSPLDESQNGAEEELQPNHMHRNKGDFQLVSSSIYPKIQILQHRQHNQNDFNDAVAQTTMVIDSSKSDAPGKTVPRPKSPGYSVLADILSSNGVLFNLITKLLVEDFDAKVDTAYILQAMSLFGEATPSYDTAKAGRDYILTEHNRNTSQLSLKALDFTFAELLVHPLVSEIIEDIDESPLHQKNRSTSMKSDTLVWRQHSILVSLRILCAAAARHNSFSACSKRSNQIQTVVPVMRFQWRELGQNNPLLIKTVQLTPLWKKILEKSFDPSMNARDEFFLSTLTEYVGYELSSQKNGNAIALAAMSLIKYVCNSSSPKEYIGCMYAINPSGHTATVEALSTRLSLIPLLKDHDKECSLCEEILDLILGNLEQSSTGKENLAHILLGLTELTVDEKKLYLQKSLQGVDVEICHYRNALDSILDLLSDVDFILDPETSSLASKCFQIIYRLCDCHANSQVDPSWPITKLCIMNKLRKSNFWQKQLLRFLGSDSTSNSILRMTVHQSPIITQRITEKSDGATIKRDSDVLHCISWLLKGVALEIHSLMGAINGTQNLNLSGKFSTSSPQPEQCRQLLQLLLCDNICCLLDALVDLPLTKPSKFTDELLLNRPPNDAIAQSSCPMGGPADISSGFTVIDVDHLCAALEKNSQHSNYIEDIKLWAELWNNYVAFACSSSHITKSWSFLACTIFTSCRQLLLRDSIFPGASVCKENYPEVLLKTILLRLNGEERESLNVFTNCLDKGALFALSTATIPIVETILARVHTGTVCNSELIQILSLLFHDIVICSSEGGACDGLKEEMAAIFASMLSAFLESDLAQTNSMLQNLSSQIDFRKKALEASVFLTTLSCRELSLAHSHSLRSVPHTARSGLSSILKWFNENERTVDVQNSPVFILELFAKNSSRNALLCKLVDLVSTPDGDVPNVLESIACCHHGTELLVDAGITKALLKISSKQISQIGTRPRNLYRFSDTSHDQYIYGHVSLISTMLSSDTSEVCLRRLLSDTAKIVSNYRSTIENLFHNFPENEELLIDFVKILALISDSMVRSGGIHDLYQLFDPNVIKALNHQIEGFALHICQYPFPNKFLPLLPSQLTEARIMQGQDSNRCWWDNIRPSQGNERNFDELILPDPPVATCGRFSSGSQDKWNLHGYEMACRAMECVDICLTSMMSRVSHSKVSIQNDGITLSIALYRLIETARAIEDRIKTTTISEEEDITSMLNITNIANYTHSNEAKLKAIQRVEIVSLEKLGTLLASCLVKLMQLTYADIENVIGSGISAESYPSFKISSTCLLTTLDSTNIEIKGIGCLGILGGSQFLPTMSRDTIVKLKLALSKLF